MLCTRCGAAPPPLAARARFRARRSARGAGNAPRTAPLLHTQCTSHIPTGACKRARARRARAHAWRAEPQVEPRASLRSIQPVGRSVCGAPHPAGQPDPDRIAPATPHPGATGCRRPRAGFRSDSGPFDSAAESNSIESACLTDCGGAGPLPLQFGSGRSGLALGLGVGFGWQRRQLIQNSTRFVPLCVCCACGLCLSYDMCSMRVCGAGGPAGRDLARG